MQNIEHSLGDRNLEMEPMAMRQEVYQMGANDFEIPAIDAIIQEFKDSLCTAEEALKRVAEIRNRKQDYH